MSERTKSWVAYCEDTPDRRVVENSGKEWTPTLQESWDHHQAAYEKHLRETADELRAKYPNEIVSPEKLEEFIEVNKGRLLVYGPWVGCKPVDLTCLDAYGGKLRAETLADQGWKIQQCLVCGAFVRIWPIPDDGVRVVVR